MNDGKEEAEIKEKRRLSRSRREEEVEIGVEKN